MAEVDSGQDLIAKDVVRAAVLGLFIMVSFHFVPISFNLLS